MPESARRIQSTPVIRRPHTISCCDTEHEASQPSRKVYCLQLTGATLVSPLYFHSQPTHTNHIPHRPPVITLLFPFPPSFFFPSSFSVCSCTASLLTRTPPFSLLSPGHITILNIPAARHGRAHPRPSRAKRTRSSRAAPSSHTTRPVQVSLEQGACARLAHLLVMADPRWRAISQR
ncbi:hypothetical protein BDV93DRAFT_315584 [Ceratobasidium sp. AG-I]|nr:hypothetical protein BDV93DRAFT_315584 [Ceratobasidium sp. AG-I]